MKFIKIKKEEKFFYKKKISFFLKIILVISLVLSILFFTLFNKKYKKEIINESLFWNKVRKNSFNYIEDTEKNHFLNQKNNDNAFSFIKLSLDSLKEDNFIDAEKYLFYALKKTDDKILKSIINFRIAKIQLQQKKISEVKKTIKKIKGKEWKELVKNILGDLELIQGNTNAARLLYEEAILSKKENLRELLKIKLFN